MNPRRANLPEGPDRRLKPEERAFLSGLQKAIRAGALELPQLPSSSSRAIALAQDPKVGLEDIVDVLASDPSLSSFLLRTANSSAIGGRHEVGTLRDAITRVGLRRLRTIVLAASMRSMIKGPDVVMDHAAEIWRQANSVAVIAQSLAGQLGIDSERAMLVGLLHDVGKIPILARLGAHYGSELKPLMVGTAYHLFHEEAGATMARAWSLSSEITSVAACHHSFAKNEAHGNMAALVSLAGKVDFMLQQEGDVEVDLLPELQFLGIEPDRAETLIEHGRTATKAAA